jgi:hypothetical protein
VEVGLRTAAAVAVADSSVEHHSLSGVSAIEAHS